MDLDTFQKYLGKAIKFLFGALLFMFLTSLMVLEWIKKPPEVQKKNFEKFVAQKYGLDFNENYPKPWPPAMNATYPDFDLIDQTGAKFKISDLKGKILLIEWVDMSSPISQAYSNAAESGVFGTVDKIDQFVLPIEKMIAKETSDALILPNDNVQILKIIIQTQNNQQPQQKDAEEWAAFFKYTKDNNVIVAVPVKDMRGKLTDAITPGFQLLDADLMLRVDSAGANPKHNLQMTLVPMLPKLLGL